jgi:hypothetical protein
MVLKLEYIRGGFVGNYSTDDILSEMLEAVRTQGYILISQRPIFRF